MTIQEFWTPPKLAKRAGKHVDWVHSLIESGQLKASNVGAKSRPRWLIQESDFQAYLTAKSNRKNKPATRRRKQTFRKSELADLLSSQ